MFVDYLLFTFNSLHDWLLDRHLGTRTGSSVEASRAHITTGRGEYSMTSLILPQEEMGAEKHLLYYHRRGEYNRTPHTLLQEEVSAVEHLTYYHRRGWVQ